MALTNVILLSQTAGYVIGLILSLCIIVPMSLHQKEFRGHCLLLSTGTWQEADGQFNVQWATQAYCNYTIFAGLSLFLISLIHLYRSAVYLYKGTDSSFLSSFIDVLICMYLCPISFMTSAIITLGFKQWCQDMTLRFPSCEMAAGQDFDKKDGINTTNFYIEMGTAQFGAWASFATWVGLTVFATLKVCHYHQMENIRVSMYRERRRLINEDVSAGSSLQRDNLPGQFDDNVPPNPTNG